MTAMRGGRAWGILLVVALVASLGLAGQTFAGKVGNAAGARKIVVFEQWVVDGACQDEVLGHTTVVKVKDLPLINAAVVVTSPASEKALRRQAGILRVDPDVTVYAQARPQPSPPPERLPWGVDRIDADLVWDADHNLALDPGANAGIGVRVAVLDTGIDLDHPDLLANIKGGVNTISATKSADDDNGHGTHVAGIIAAVDNQVGVLGVAPCVSLYPVKVLNKQGSGYLSDIVEGLQWCVSNGIQVANMSLGTSSDVPSLHDAVIAAHRAGLVLVAAAGNSGPGGNTVLYPAKYPEVIAVSATDAFDAVPSWSSRGAEVELAAPGVSIYSTYRGGGYKTLSGTSMAAPHVAGTAALVVASGIADANGDGAINDEVRARLVSTADDLGSPGRDNLYGWGLVDADGAAAAPASP